MEFRFMRYFQAVILMACCFCSVHAQTTENKGKGAELNMRDSLDHQFDMSDVILKKKGFVPVPIIITEPALGGFGGGVIPVFIKPNPPREMGGKRISMQPDITALFGFYTLNNSWGVGGYRSGAINRDMRYALAAGYVDVNLDFYFYLKDLQKEVRSKFNVKTIPVFASLTKILRDPRFSVELNYSYLHNELNRIDISDLQTGSVIDSIVNDNLSGDVGRLGLKLAYDTRDNVFTPNRGMKTYISGNWSNPVVGSDYYYGQMSGAFFYYFPLRHNLITGTRFDMQQILGNLPFYMRPFIDMRGIPMMRYQGKTTVLTELEERWDFTFRWSLMLYGGLGKAFDQYQDFGSSKWAWSYGTGFRYLMARKLNLRMGLDFAMGPEGFTYYIVFGSRWARQ